MSWPLIFAQPALLAGVAAAAAPWIIHLLLRPRPTRVIFPALAMLRPALAAGRRASRLRHLWLLLLRSLILFMLAVVLAGPACRSSAAGPREIAPAAHILVLDDSPSMSYRESDRTCAEIARTAALRVLEQSSQHAAESSWTLIRTSAALRTALIAGPASRVARTLSAPEWRPHAATLADSLRLAASLARENAAAVEVLIATDQAAHAWRDVPPRLFAGLDGVRVKLLSPGGVLRANLAVVGVIAPRPLPSDGGAADVSVSALSQRITAAAWLIAAGGGDILARAPVPRSRDRTAEIPLRFPTLPDGPHPVCVSIEPADRLDFDQRRYAVLVARPRPRVWAYETADAARQLDLGLTIARNLIAPAALDPALHLANVRAADAATLAAAQPTDVDFVLLPADADLPEPAAAALHRVVERGGHVLVIPSRAPRADWAGFADALFAAPPVRTETPARIRWKPVPPFADAELDDGLAELQRCRVAVRLSAAPAAGCVVLAAYDDGEPALLSKVVGRGVVWALTTSPDPAWSELGQRAAGLLTTLHRIVELSAGGREKQPSFIVGESGRDRLPALVATGPARVTRLEDTAAAPTWVQLTEGRPDRDWPADQPGTYAVEPARHSEPRAYYAVNWPPEESDLTPIEPAEIARRLGVSNVEMIEVPAANGPAAPSRIAATWSQVPVETALATLLALLAVVELVAANAPRRTP